MTQTFASNAAAVARGWHRRIPGGGVSLRLMFLVIIGFGAAPAVTVAADPIPQPFETVSNMAQVRQWSGKLIETSLMVDLTGVVTGIFPELSLVVLHDDTGNAGIKLDLERFPFLKAHQRIRLAGLGRFGGGETSLLPAELIDNDGAHAAKEVSGRLYLTKGMHPFSLSYFQAVRQQSLKVEYEGPDTSRMPLPRTALFHVANPEEPEAHSEPGLKFDYYEGVWDGLPDFGQMEPIKSGIVEDISLDLRQREDNYALRFNGLLKIDKSGEYVFHLTSDDGSRLFVQEIPTSVTILSRNEPVATGSPKAIRVGRALLAGEDYFWGLFEGRINFIGRTGKGWNLVVDSDGVEMRILLNHANLPTGLVNNCLIRAAGFCQTVLDEHDRRMPGTLLVPLGEDPSCLKILPANRNSNVQPATPWSTLSTNYQTVLQGGAYANNNTTLTVILNNLSAGHTYQVQFWANDSRFYGHDRTEMVTNSGGNAVTLHYNNTGTNGGVGQYTIGTFTATSTTQVFTLTGILPAGNNSAQLNALQVRDLGVSTFTNHWSSPVGVSADTDVSTNGSLLYACAGSGAAATVNTVPFVAGFSPNVFVRGAFGSIPAGFGEDSGASLPVLTSADQIRQLKPEEAARSYPVRLRGTITARQTIPEGIIQDLTSAVYVRFDLRKGQQVSAGNCYELTGVTSPGNFAPVFVAHEVINLGPGRFPKPLHPDYAQMRSGSLDCQWVELQGMISHFDGKSREAQLVVKGGNVGIYFIFNSDWSFVETLSNAFVRIRGCVVPARTATGELAKDASLWVPSLSCLTVDQSTPVDPFDAPLRKISEFSKFDPNPNFYQMTKVRGQVLHLAEPLVYFTDGTDVMRILPKSLPELMVGDRVEAVGLPEAGLASPLLIEASIRKIGHANLPEPALINVEQSSQPEYDAHWVRIEGRLSEIRSDLHQTVLELQSGLRNIQAVAPSNYLQATIPPPGSLISLRGVVAQSQNGKAGITEPTRLLFNSPADITCLELPPFWNQQRAMWAIEALISAVSLAGLWIYLLRRTVAKRTRALQLEMNERQAAEEKVRGLQTQRALEEQRARIARNIHDDLGARATKLSLLAHCQPDSEADLQAHLDIISSTSRQIVEALDETVWTVNPANDSLVRLAGYLIHYAQDFFRNTSIHCRLDIPTDLPELSVTAEFRFTIFLLVKEALNNVLKHSGAQNALLQMRASANQLQLTIQDDGCGFNPDSVARRNGLNNLQTRVMELGGQMTIQSAPGGGTRISITAPLADPKVKANQ